MDVSSQERWVLALESFTGIPFIVCNSPGKKCANFCCVHGFNLQHIVWEKSCFFSASLWGMHRRAGVNLSFAVCG